MRASVGASRRPARISVWALTPSGTCAGGGPEGPLRATALHDALKAASGRLLLCGGRTAFCSDADRVQGRSLSVRLGLLGPLGLPATRWLWVASCGPVLRRADVYRGRRSHSSEW